MTHQIKVLEYTKTHDFFILTQAIYLKIKWSKTQPLETPKTYKCCISIQKNMTLGIHRGIEVYGRNCAAIESCSSIGMQQTTSPSKAVDSKGNTWGMDLIGHTSELQ